MVQHLEASNRSVHVVNLDPAAEHFDYPVTAGEYSPLLIHVRLNRKDTKESHSRSLSVPSTSYYIGGRAYFGFKTMEPGFIVFIVLLRNSSVTAATLKNTKKMNI